MTRPTITGIAALILTIFFAFVSTASAAPKSGSGATEKSVVASVGEEPITLESFYAFIKELPANMQMQARAGKEMFLEALIQRRLIVRYATENNFLASERVKMQMARARREILIAEAVRRVEERSKPKAAQIRAEYEQNKSKFTEGDKVTASHIMVASEKEAKDLLAKIVKGEDFAELAKQYSLAPERSLGGSLGAMSRGHSRRTGLPEVIEQTAFSLKAGAHSGVVKSVYGWHVVKTAKMEKGKQLGFDEVKEKITEEMGARNKREAMRKVLLDLSTQYKVKRYLENLK